MMIDIPNCPVCDKELTTIDGYQSHMRDSHGEFIKAVREYAVNWWFKGVDPVNIFTEEQKQRQRIERLVGRDSSGFYLRKDDGDNQ